MERIKALMAMWFVGGFCLVGCAGIMAGLSEENQERVTTLTEVVKKAEQDIRDTRAKIQKMIDSGSVDPVALAQLTAKISEYQEIINESRKEMEAIFKTASELSTLDKIGYFITSLVFGALGYLGIGRPARLMAGKYVLNKPTS